VAVSCAKCMREQVQGLEGGMHGGTHALVQGTTRHDLMREEANRVWGKGATDSGVGGRAVHDHGACDSD
jgi:hypothetical protein